MEISFSDLTSVIITSGIFLLGLLTFLLTGVNYMLNAKTDRLMENNKQILQKHSDSISSEMDAMKVEIKNNKQILQKHSDSISSEMDAMKVEIQNNKKYMEKRLDQLSKTDGTILKLIEELIALKTS